MSRPPLHGPPYGAPGSVPVLTEHWAIFDLDGVILDSVTTKQAAFRTVFEDRMEVEEIDAYNKAHMGVPRRMKIAHVLSEICGQEATPSAVAEAEIRYRAEIERRSQDVALVPGARELLVKERPFDCAVNSSAPHAEVLEALDRHGITRWFVEIHGFPEAKASVLKRMREVDPNRALVFLGDAQADQDAAREAGVPFIVVGVEAVRDPAHRILDLSDTEGVVGMIMAVATPASGRTRA